MVADAGVVDQDVQPAEPAGRGVDHRARVQGDVRVQRGHRQALVFHLRNGRRVPAGVPGHDHDLGARLPQGGGKRLAQPLIPAGDHGLAAIQRKTLQYPHMPSSLTAPAS